MWDFWFIKDMCTEKLFFWRGEESAKVLDMTKFLALFLKSNLINVEIFVF